MGGFPRSYYKAKDQSTQAVKLEQCKAKANK